MRRLLAIIGAALVALGLAIGSYGSWLAGSTVHGLLFDAATDGEVVGHERDWLRGGSSGNRMLSRPMVAFVDAAGRTHHFTDSMSATPELANGTRVRVWYDPADPARARIAATRMWSSALGLLQVMGGGLCLLLGLLVLLLVRFARRSG